MGQMVPVALAVALAVARRGWRVDRGPSVPDASRSGLRVNRLNLSSSWSWWAQEAVAEPRRGVLAGCVYTASTTASMNHIRVRLADWQIGGLAGDATQHAGDGRTGAGGLAGQESEQRPSAHSPTASLPPHCSSRLICFLQPLQPALVRARPSGVVMATVCAWVHRYIHACLHCYRQLPPPLGKQESSAAMQDRSVRSIFHRCFHFYDSRCIAS